MDRIAMATSNDETVDLAVWRAVLAFRRDGIDRDHSVECYNPRCRGGERCRWDQRPTYRTDHLRSEVGTRAVPLSCRTSPCPGSRTVDLRMLYVEHAESGFLPLVEGVSRSASSTRRSMRVLNTLQIVSTPGQRQNQNSLPLARYVFERYGKRVFMVGSDYIYPFESNRIMADLIEQAGGEVLGEIYVPLQAEAADFAPAIREIALAEPDAIFSTVVGRSTAIFYEEYHKAGFDPAVMPITSLTTSEAELAEMSVAAAAGHITAAPFLVPWIPRSRKPSLPASGHASARKPSSPLPLRPPIFRLCLSRAR